MAKIIEFKPVKVPVYKMPVYSVVTPGTIRKRESVRLLPANHSAKKIQCAKLGIALGACLLVDRFEEHWHHAWLLALAGLAFIVGGLMLYIYGKWPEQEPADCEDREECREYKAAYFPDD